MRANRAVPGDRLALIFVFMLVLIASPLKIRGDDRYFVGLNGSAWASFTNWNTQPDGGGNSGLPLAGDIANLVKNTDLLVNFSVPFPSPQLGGMYLDGTGGAEVVLAQSANSLSADFNVIGRSGRGKFLHSAGTNDAGVALILGADVGSAGTYVLSGEGIVLAFDEHIGSTGSGIFQQQAGTNSASNIIYIGSEATGDGKYTLSGGTINAGAVVVGSSGTGQFVHSASTVHSSLYVGNLAGSTGTYTLSDGNVLAVEERVGAAGKGTFTQNGGDNSVSDILFVGSEPGGNGKYVLSGGSLSAAAIVVGEFGTGEFIHGTGSIDTQVVVGNHAGAVGTYTLSPGTELTTAGDHYIGNAGQGTFEHLGGAHTVDGILFIGGQDGGSGSYAMSGGTLDAGQLITGEFGHGEFIHTAGKVTAGQIIIANHDSATGQYTLGAGTTVSTGDLYVGREGAGTFEHQGGSNTVAGTLYIAAEAGASGTYNLSGGSLSASATVNNGQFHLVGGAATLGAVTGGGDLSVAGGTTLRADYVRQNKVLLDGILVTEASDDGSAVSVINDLDIAGATNAWSGTFDLKNNILIVRGSLLATVRNQIKYGLVNGHGLISTSNASGGILGAILNKNPTGAGVIYSSFGGVPNLVNTDVIVRYTLKGDVNLDGCVTISDFIDLASNFGGAGDWLKGDNNYDDQVSISDFIDLASNFSRCIGGTQAAQAPGVTSVPEPGSAGMAAGLALLAMVRRRRRRGR